MTTGADSRSSSVCIVDSRLDLAPELEELSRALAARAVGLYVGGSIASRDYRPGVSDIDAVALVDKPPRPAVRDEIIALHTRLAESHRHGEALHCVYVPLTDAVDPARRHWTWAFGELFRRPLSRIARAELLATLSWSSDLSHGHGCPR